MNVSSLSKGALLVLAVAGICLPAGDLLAQKAPRKGKNPTATAPAAGEVSRKVADAVVLEVGREKFTVGQIADAYMRNTNRGGKTFYQLDRDSALAFLDLYSRYRLKVQTAVDQGLDQKPEVIQDLENNRTQLAVPPPPQSGYLIERKVVDPAVERIFKLRGEEVKVGVIFTAMRPNDPSDTLRALNRTFDMLKRIRAGEDFKQMALDSSDDRQFQAAGGSLWITGGMLFPAMEEAAYMLKPGMVYDAPIRVPAGFVILKVLDRGPRIRVHAAHIFVAVPPGDTATTGPAAMQKAQNLMAMIARGVKFDKLARDSSEDATSGRNGGDLGSYYTRSLGFEGGNARLWTQFEDALFAAKDGEVVGPIRTTAGYHIIKRIDSKVPEFADEKETIRTFYKQQLMAEDRAAYVRKVLAGQGYKVDEATLMRLLAAVDQSRTTADTAWSARVDGALRSMTLYNFHGAPVTVGAWIDSVEARRELRATALNDRGIRNSIEFLLEPAALAQEARGLEQEYPEFASLMREFRDGILIFKLEDELIWSKLKYDEEQGKAFFEKNRSKYKTEPKLALTELFLYSRAEAQELYKRIAADPTILDSLAAAMTQRSGYREKGGRWSLSTAKNADIVKQVLSKAPAPKVGMILEPFEYQSGWSIVRVDTLEPVRPMTYEEAKPEVMGDYIDNLQQRLQDEWIATLRLKYRVKINDKALDQAVASK